MAEPGTSQILIFPAPMSGTEWQVREWPKLDTKLGGIHLLIERLGPGFASADLYNVLKCPACNSRKFLVMFSPVHVSYGNLN